MDVFLVELMVVFVLAVIVGIGFRFFKLPSIIGHVLVGLLVGTSGLISSTSVDILKICATFGITLLLFLVGLEMNWNEIKKVGSRVFVIFGVQTVLSIILFMVVGLVVFQLSLFAGFFFGITVAFSSTIVAVKSLSEKKDLSSFGGKLSLGVLLLQDLLAIGVLILLPNLKSGVDVLALVLLLGKLVALFLAINVVGHLGISFLMKKLIKSAEDLILFSLAWLMVAIYLSVKVFGLTPEVGGILAGISLSTSWGHFQIVSKVRTLRDIFVTIFFVLLGVEVGLGKIDWTMVSLLTLLAIAGKFLVTHLGSRLADLSGKVAFSVSLSVTQISEFSLIVMAAGVAANMWDEEMVKVVTVAGLLSMAISTLLISKSADLYKVLERLLPSFFKFSGDDKTKKTNLKNHVVLFGGDRTGRSILSFLSGNGEKVLVVDFNPEVISRLSRKGVTTVFADCSDPDILELTNLSDAKMVISTVKDINDSLSLLQEIKHKGIKVPVIVDAETVNQARDLYAAGATYVIFPHFVSGMHMAGLMKKFEKDDKAISKYRSKQDETMKEIYEGEYR